MIISSETDVARKKLIIFGTGDFAQLAHFYFTHDSSYEIVAFAVNQEFIKEKEFLNLPIVPFEEIEKAYPPQEYSMFIALSYNKLNQRRAERYYEAKAKGYELVNYVCSKSVIWDNVEIGDNCFIFENQTIQPFAKIGNNVTLWSGNHIGHHSVIGDHCFITSHVVVSGHVTIEPYSFLGVNCTLKDGITIATKSVIGAGATIVKDTIPGGVYMGKAGELYSKDSSKSNYFNNTNYAEREQKNKS